MYYSLSLYRISLYFLMLCVLFFFKQKTAYEMRISDWSSDVCSSDLGVLANEGQDAVQRLRHGKCTRISRSRPRKRHGLEKLQFVGVKLGIMILGAKGMKTEDGAQSQPR